MGQVNSKVLVFGEYSVLHNSMALTIPFKKFSGKLTYPKSADESAIAVLSNQGIRKFCKHIIETRTDEAFKLNVTKLTKELDKGLFFRSDIPQGFGLGSSGALVAAIFLRYIEKAGGFKDELKYFTKDKIHHLKQYLGMLEGHFHGKSSGIDPLSILINEPLLLKENQEIVQVKIPSFQVNGKHVLFLLNTKQARNSEKLINQFNKACEQESFIHKMKTELIWHTNEGISDFLNGNVEQFYPNLEKIVQFQLNEMDYLIPTKYHKTVEEGLISQDYYLKICGSGGGGFMIGFTQNWEATQEKLKDEELEILYRY